MSIQTLPVRRIGSDNVTAIGFGSMASYWRDRVLDRLVELGCTNWDTADHYGDAEDLIGKWFKRTGKRDQIFLASKFGITDALMKGDLENGIRGDPEYIKMAIEKSLGHLGVETIDLYYVHRIDSRVPIEVTMRVLVDLVKAGKIRYIGLSVPSPATLRRAHKVHPIAAIQVEYSPFVLDIEEKGHLLDTARELGIAVVAYTPTGSGLLSGQVTCVADLPEGDIRRLSPKFSDENFPNILALAAKFKKLGVAHNATGSQVALAFLLAQGDDIIPIPGSKDIKHIEENLGAAHIKLTPEEVDSIRKAIEETEIPGARYPQWVVNMHYRDTPELPEGSTV